MVFDKASAPDLQQAQPTRKQAMCKHMVDGRGYKYGDASAVKNQILKFLGYIPWLGGPLRERLRLLKSWKSDRRTSSTKLLPIGFLEKLKWGFPSLGRKKALL
ncbi:MAG TPA: hypothetical protein VFU89_01765 [Rhabdochlamydiaceae bacterium]|nr:hypothetical protein [Rhabdochlamydiaceae bacterium]